MWSAQYAVVVVESDRAKPVMGFGFWEHANEESDKNGGTVRSAAVVL